MSNKNLPSLLLTILALFSCYKQATPKQICEIDYTKGMAESQPVKLIKNNCGEYMIRDAFTKSIIYCLEACYKSEECSSVYYDKSNEYCILYRNTNSLWNFCLRTAKESPAIHAYFDREAFYHAVS